jgi:hypothetical protein
MSLSPYPSRRWALLTLGAAAFATASLAQSPPPPAPSAPTAPAATPAPGGAPSAVGAHGGDRPALTEAQRELANLIELPVMARELVAAGVAQRDVHALLVSLQSHEVSGAAASKMLRGAARGDKKDAPKLAETVKAKVEEGLRGVALAEAIHAAQGKGGRGREGGEGASEGKGGPAGHPDGAGAPESVGKGHGGKGEGKEAGAEGGPPEAAGKGRGEGKAEGAKGGKGDEKGAPRAKGGE